MKQDVHWNYWVTFNGILRFLRFLLCVYSDVFADGLTESWS